MPKSNPPLWKATTRAPLKEAGNVAALFQLIPNPAPLSVSATGEVTGPDSTIEALYAEQPDAALLSTLLHREVRVEPLPDRDWIKHSQQGLPPVRAGRFFVYGAHDKGKVPPNVVALRIEAGQAFGSGHHETTRGCLLAIDDLMNGKMNHNPPPLRGRMSRSDRRGVSNEKPPFRPLRGHLPPQGGKGSEPSFFTPPPLRGRVREGGQQTTPLSCPPSLLRSFDGHPPPQGGRIKNDVTRGVLRALDLGTGTGVLALAIAKTSNARVIAADNDPDAVDVARSNIRLNGGQSAIRVLRANGFAHADIHNAAPYDLIVANILSGPLLRLAKDIAAHMAPGGALILSGLLDFEEPRIAARYATHGFVTARRHALGPWVTLALDYRRPIARARAGR